MLTFEIVCLSTKSETKKGGRVFPVLGKEEEKRGMEEKVREQNGLLNPESKPKEISAPFPLLTLLQNILCVAQCPLFVIIYFVFLKIKKHFSNVI